MEERSRRSRTKVSQSALHEEKVYLVFLPLINKDLMFFSFQITVYILFYDHMLMLMRLGFHVVLNIITLHVVKLV